MLAGTRLDQEEVAPSLPTPTSTLFSAQRLKFKNKSAKGVGLENEILSEVLKKSGNAAKGFGLQRIVEPRKPAWRSYRSRSCLWSLQPLQEVPGVPKENRGTFKKVPEGEGQKNCL